MILSNACYINYIINPLWPAPYGNVTHGGRVTHTCVSEPNLNGSDNGLSTGRLQVIMWTYAGSLLIWPLRKYFREISIKVQTFSFNKMHLKMLSAKWRPFSLGPYVPASLITYNALTNELSVNSLLLRNWHSFLIYFKKFGFRWLYYLRVCGSANWSG